MIDPYDLYTDFKAWVNTQQGGFFPPQSVFTKVLNIANFRLWNKWTAQAEKSQEIKDNLFPFLVSKNVTTKNANSYYCIAPQPENYGRFASAKILLNGENKCVDDKRIGAKTDEELAQDYYDNVTESEVEMIDNQRWASLLKHLTKKPTFENPKITQINNEFKVAPKEVSVIVFNYYTIPKPAVFVYTVPPGNLQTGAGGQIVYNANASQSLQWPITVKEYLLETMKKVYIQYTRDMVFAKIENPGRAAGTTGIID